MAEENHYADLATDDVTVLRELLQTVKGLSPVSSAPYVSTTPDSE